MDETGAVEQDVDRAGLRRKLADGCLVEHVELARDDAVHAVERLELRGIDVGGPNLGPFARKRPGRSRTDPLPGRRDDAGLALQTHFSLPALILFCEAGPYLIRPFSL